jgi:hypothetical protein
MMIDDGCFLFSPRFSLHIASHLGHPSGRSARAAVIVEQAGRSEDQRPLNAKQDSHTTETI